MQEANSPAVKHVGAVSPLRDGELETGVRRSSRAHREPPSGWRRCPSGVRTLARGSSPGHLARSAAAETPAPGPGGARRALGSAPPPREPAARHFRPSHPLPGRAEPPAPGDCRRCRAVGVPCPGEPEQRCGRAERCLPRAAPRRRPRARRRRRGVAPRACAAVPGRREPALRRSATLLPGRPVHLAGEGGRCQ